MAALEKVIIGSIRKHMSASYEHLLEMPPHDQLDNDVFDRIFELSYVCHSDDIVYGDDAHVLAQLVERMAAREGIARPHHVLTDERFLNILHADGILRGIREREEAAARLREQEAARIREQEAARLKKQEAVRLRLEGAQIIIACLLAARASANMAYMLDIPEADSEHDGSLDGDCTML